MAGRRRRKPRKQMSFPKEIQNVPTQPPAGMRRGRGVGIPEDAPIVSKTPDYDIDKISLGEGYFKSPDYPPERARIFGGMQEDWYYLKKAYRRP